MNPKLQLLQPYPFEKLRQLFKEVIPNAQVKPINLSIGEPKHPTPQFIREALSRSLDGLANYPVTIGRDSLREAIADWLKRRYSVARIDPITQVIPTLGSREALFSLAQAVLDSSKADGLVLCPNPFYQIYEGAALLAGLRPHFINTLPETRFRHDWGSVPEEIWRRVQLVFTCSPGNPSGAVMTLDEWRELFALSDKYGFVIVADECYTEIYFEENNPPLGALDAAERLGRGDFPRLVVLGSLSKRSNVPGMRSGFAAGDASIIKQFTLYRTYHGSAMGGAIQSASEAAWKDEAHVRENRRLYAEKFETFYNIVNPVLPLTKPAASFYYWVRTPIDDKEFAVRLLRDVNVTVLPGSLLGRDAHGLNPGQNFVRVALVSSIAESTEAAHRIRNFIEKLS
ncbi:MAG TPA: succinyldiaminopimelate transaminase [Burkholderiales bacterium]|nr:succinyldiaminopimelate transaminase [Burkholderiales bacterium]